MSEMTENKYELGISQQELQHKYRKHRVPHYRNKLHCLIKVVMALSMLSIKFKHKYQTIMSFRKSSVLFGIYLFKFEKLPSGEERLNFSLLCQ